MADYSPERLPVEANDNSTDNGINVVELLKEGQGTPTSVDSDDLPCLSVDWAPDLKYETASGKKWLEEAREQDKKDLETTDNNTYVVEKGDSFWGIAKRSLRDQKGETPVYSSNFFHSKRYSSDHQNQAHVRARGPRF